ncbi:sugar MFS transporter [candidate division KSB1 bacterium]
MANEGVSRKFLTAAACSGAFVYGVVIILIGVTLGAFAERLSMPGATLGFYFFFFLNIGVFIAFFAVGPLIDRIGKKAVLVIGTFIVGVCMILAGISQSYQMICLWMFLLGAGAAGINGGGNTLVNDLYPENPSKALNLVNIFFSFGFVALPLIASWLMVNLGLTALMIVAAVLCFVPTVLYGINKFPPPTMGSAFKLNEAGKAVSEPLVILLALVLFCYIGLEVSTSGWTRSFLEAEHGIGTSSALLALAGFGVAMMIGRLVAGTVLSGVKATKMVLGSSLLAAVSLAIFISAQSVWLALIALWLVGAFYGPIFPSSLGTAGISFTRYVGTIFSLCIGIGVLGSVILAPAIGKVAQGSGLQAGLWLAFATAVVMAILQIFVMIRARKFEKPATAPAAPAESEATASPAE